MSKFLVLPGNNLVLKSAVVAVRVYDGSEVIDCKPSINVDFAIGKFGGAVAIPCETTKYRDDLAAVIRKELKA